MNLNHLIAIAGSDAALELFRRFPTYRALAQADALKLQETPGVGPKTAACIRAAIGIAYELPKEIEQERPLCDTPERIAELMSALCIAAPKETFWAVLLDTRRRLIEICPVSTGTLDSVFVHPRDVFRAAIAANASGIVLVHNHPSGDPTPSEADIKVTRDLIRAGQLLKLEIVDHVICGRASTERSRAYASLRELGFFYAFRPIA